MIKLTIALKRMNSTVRIRWLVWKLEHLVNTPWLAILMITVCWGNWNDAGTFPLTCIVKFYEITLEKCIYVGRTIVNTVPPRDKNKLFSVSMNIWEKLWWEMTLLLLGCTGFDDWNVPYFFTYKPTSAISWDPKSYRPSNRLVLSKRKRKTIGYKPRAKFLIVTGHLSERASRKKIGKWLNEHKS